MILRRCQRQDCRQSVTCLPGETLFHKFSLAKLRKWPGRCYDFTMDTADAAPSPTQRRVLVALKRRGEATADELSTTLEISPSAVRQHLSALRSAGLIAARKARGQPGRPADLYHTTERTEPLFVTPDSTLSIELLGHIEEEDPRTRGPNLRPTSTSTRRKRERGTGR